MKYCSCGPKVETTQISIPRWIDKENMVYIHMMEYYSAIKRNEVLTPATRWTLEILCLTKEESHKRLCIKLVFYGCHKKAPQSRYLKQQKFNLLQFWGSEVQNQHVSRAGSFWSVFLLYLQGGLTCGRCPPCVFTLSSPCARLFLCLNVPFS